MLKICLASVLMGGFLAPLSAQQAPEAANPDDHVIRDGSDENSFRVTFFLGQEHSNIYREKPSDGFFANSKGMLDLEFDHRWKLGGSRFLVHNVHIGLRGAFGYKSNQGTLSNDDGTAVNPDQIAKASQSFFTGLSFAHLWKGRNYAVGPVVGLTWAVYPTEDGTTSQDRIRSIPKFGVATEYVFGEGSKVSTRSEVTIQNDPVFAIPKRVVALGRLTYHGIMGQYLTVFLEGEINKGLGSGVKNPGRIGKDVGSIRIGTVINPGPMLEAIGGMFKAK